MGTLVAANPVVVLALFKSGLISAMVLVGIVAAVQASYKPGAQTPLFGYAMNFLIVGSVLLHGEFALRTYFPGHVVPNIYQIEDGYFFNLPFLHLTFEDEEYRAVYATNGQGVRISEAMDPNRAMAATDWVFIGDSFTQGAQVAFEALYTSRLHQRFPERSIVNLGASGLGIAEELALYRSRGAGLNPSTVFLQIAPFNDFMNVEPRRFGISERLMERSSLFRTIMHRWRFEDPRSLPLGRWTEPFYPDPESNRRFNVFYRDTSPGKERDLELFERFLREFKGAVEGESARLVVVLFPTREQTSDAALSEVLSAFAIDPAALDMARPNEMLLDLGRELGIEVIDLLPKFREAGAGAFFTWDEHLTAHGHAIVAEGLAEAIAPWASSATPSTRVIPIDSARYPRPCCGGGRVSFQAPVRGSMEVFTFDVESSGVTQLTFDGEAKSHPMISGSADFMVYTRGEAAGMRTEVVYMDIRTGRATTLTSGLGEFGAIPTLSPDDRYVTYAEWREPGQDNTLTNPVIVVLNLRTGRKEYLTDGRHESWRPIFSPDGGSIAFIANPEGQFDVFQLDLATRETVRLTATPYDEWDPGFSQSGQEVLYAGRKDGNWDLFMVNALSGRERRLTKTKGDEWDPVFGLGDASVLFGGEFGMFSGVYAMALKPVD